MTALNTGNRRSPLADRGDDLYETPPEAVLALLRHELLPGVIWEPACGPGAIAAVLRAAGHIVHASDLVDYASPHQDAARRDFLLERELPPGTQCICSNPPFKLANEFVAHALSLCPRVIMLLRLGFIESTRRSTILDGGYLRKIYVFANRLPGLHRDGWDGPRASNAVAYCWFVWDTRQRGDTVIRRIRWTASRNVQGRLCYGCGEFMTGRSDRRWHNDACRQRAYRRRANRARAEVETGMAPRRPRLNRPRCFSRSSSASCSAPTRGRAQGLISCLATLRTRKVCRPNASRSSGATTAGATQ